MTRCLGLTSFFLLLDVLHDGFYLRKIQILRFSDGQSGADKGYTILGTHGNLSVALHNADLDVFRTGLHNLKETLHSEFDTVFTRHVVFVVLFQKLSNGFGRPADRVGLALT
jgi:hypothetical protein